MRWSSSVVEGEDTVRAARRLASDLRGALAGDPAHLVLLFATPHHAPQLDNVLRCLKAELPGARVVGCTGGAVLAAGRELEGQPALAALAGSLPDVAVVPFRVTSELMKVVMADPRGWHTHLDIIPEQQPLFLLLPDPFTHRTDALIASLDAAYPGLPKLGGLASGGRNPGEHALVLDDAVHRSGAVGVALYGDIAVDAVVAQGARPVGPLLEVTAAEDNLMLELDGRPAAEALDEVFGGLDETEQRRFRRGPMVGLALPEATAARPGDFLVRDLVGVERDGGRIAVGGPVRAGQRVRFHLRDPAAAADDLRQQLLRWKLGHQGAAPAAAILLTCLGRGAGFFGAADHDSTVLREIAGEVPLAGFFCNGELGPVHGRTWLHGYTSAIGLLRPRGWS